jgi:TRAP-type C4-dicarboxylate transport system substrate-binding protein
MLRKMHIGQIQAAMLTAAGLSAIFSDLDVFQIPFLFKTYAEVDDVVEKMDAVFRKGLADKGYTLLGWMEGGFVQLMSTTPIATISDLQKAKVWTWQDSPMAKAIFDEAKVAAIPLSVPDVLVGLQTGLVDVVYAPPTGAIALQWFTRIKFITDVPLIYLLGGLVVKKADYDKIAPEHQRVISEILPQYMARIKDTIRRENSEAIDVMTRQGVQLLKPTAEQVADFKRISDQAMERMQGETFSAGAREQVVGHLKAFREAHQ